MEMGPGDGLAAHLGTTRLDFRPREVRPGLHAMRVVRSDALLEYLAIQLGLRQITRLGPFARAFDALATAAPAIREIITIGKVAWEVEQDRWDLVVADSPPTGQIGSYLRAPRSIAELVPTGRIRAQADRMEAVLANALLLLVTTPEELPVTEIEETLAWIEKQRRAEGPPAMPTTMVMANRALDALADETTPPGPVGEAARLHRSLHDEQLRWLSRLRPERTLPYLFGLLTPGEVAARLSDSLEGQE